MTPLRQVRDSIVAPRVTPLRRVRDSIVASATVGTIPPAARDVVAEAFR